MGDFGAHWLDLRESADAAARSGRLASRLAQWLARVAVDGGEVQVLDLGCGTGSNLRWLAPRLVGSQHWICLDKDPALVAVLPRETGEWARRLGIQSSPRPDGLLLTQSGATWTVETHTLDLAAGPRGLPWQPGALVTASALLDLAGADWLDSLVRQCAALGCPQLYALSFDGRVELTPREPLDGLVIALVNGHQRRDKGLGPALGPSAPGHLLRLAQRLGLVYDSADSDWALGPEETGLQEGLIAGWAAAAREQVADHAGSGAESGRHIASISRWQGARLGHVAAGRSHLRVGHRDILLLPFDTGCLHQTPPPG